MKAVVRTARRGALDLPEDMSHLFVDVVFAGDDGRESAMVRHNNPDGSVGGFVVAGADVHPTATIHRTSIVGPGVVVPAHAVVGPDCLVDSDLPESLRLIKLPLA